jgi:hypothetical protein
MLLKQWKQYRNIYIQDSSSSLLLYL